MGTVAKIANKMKMWGIFFEERPLTTVDCRPWTIAEVKIKKDGKTVPL
jgi:hypothetical protein